MKIKARRQAQPVIPTSSMADIAFLLIVFFMVTATFEKDKTQVALPKTDLRYEIPKEAAYISITETGYIRATDGEEMASQIDIADVVSFAANVVSLYPNRPIVLKADSNVNYEHVDKVLDSLKQAKVNLIYLLSEQKTVDGGGGPA